MMNIVFLDAKTVGEVPNLHLLEQLGKVTYYPSTSPEQVVQRMADAHVVITNKVVVNATAIHGAQHLRLICVAATGTNNVDKAAAEQRDIPVKNVAGYSTDSVAQATFAMLLHLINHIAFYSHVVKSGAYSQSDIFTNVDQPWWELKGKRFGIIGLGSIGRRVAAIASVFGAGVVYYSASGQTYQQPYERLSLEQLLHTSDVVCIHAPLNQYTTNLVTYDRLRQMKPSAILINVGRGGIVNEAGLAKAIDDGLIAGAGVDVYEQEPIPPDNPLLHVRRKERLLLTPHVAWSGIEARTLLIEKVAQNIRQHINGQG